MELKVPLGLLWRIADSKFMGMEQNAWVLSECVRRREIWRLIHLPLLKITV